MDKREKHNAAKRKLFNEMTPEQRDARNAKARENYHKRKARKEYVSGNGCINTNLIATELQGVVQNVPRHGDSEEFSFMELEHLRRETINARRREARRIEKLPSTNGDLFNGVVPDTVRMRNKINKQKSEFAETTEIHTFGCPDRICYHCGALAWSAEQTHKQKQEHAWGLTLCCGEGKVELPYLQPAPPELENLLNGTHQLSAHFKLYIRAYNTIFAFTSMGGDIDENINRENGPYVFRLCGQTYHLIGSLLPEEGRKPIFAQLYMFDATDIDGRINSLPKQGEIKAELVQMIQQMLSRHNRLTQIFHHVRDRFSDEDYIPVKFRLLANRETDGRDTNIPSNAFEFGGLIPAENFNDPLDIVIEHRSSGLHRISNVHPSYMALQYPLLFPYGEDGFRPNILHRGISHAQPDKKNCLSMREYYAFRLQYRENEGHTLLEGGRLKLQFVVDAWTSTEHARLTWVLDNQATLRSELYNNVIDAVARGDTCPLSVGKSIILPPTFIGSPRYMQQNYHDALAVCRKYGHPDLFITFTCNPRWSEVGLFIERLPNSDPTTYPEIIARMFHMKLQALLLDLTENNILGRVTAIVYTIEFQKRGLPHVHMVLWLSDADKCHTPEEIDSIISAELPDKDSDPIGFQSVTEFMIHGPCGELNPKCPCMKESKCTKRFPRDFQSMSHIDENGYPIYRRRDDGKTCTKGGVNLDNRYVVPYNRGLVVKYQAHINVEWCNRTLSIKYLFKYMSKGADRATMIVERNENSIEASTSSTPRVLNEVDHYLACRYVSSAEACWRLFKYPIHYRKPFVQRLYFHLEGEQEVKYREDLTLPEVVRKTNPNSTMLIQWMRTNMESEFGIQLTYVQFPEFFCWDNQSKMWSQRKRKTDVVGRLIYAHPASGEKFYLRRLLNVVKGARSFEDIRTVEGTIYPSYKEACFHRGLLDSDAEWHEALKDAAIFQTGRQLRELFVIMLLFCEVGDVLHLWNDHWETLAEDMEYMQRKITSMPFLVLTEVQKKALAIYEINNLLTKNGKSLQDFPTLPSVDPDLVSKCQNRLLQEEMSYNRLRLKNEHQSSIMLLNQGQRKVYDDVIQAVESKHGGMFFVYGQGGTGKTFLWTTIISKLRSEGKVVLAVASSGIASLLLEGGRTAHSRFKIPLQIDQYSSCDLRTNTMLAELICEADLVIWDEAPMTHRYVFEAVDRSLRDLVRVLDPLAGKKPFGGKTMLLGGDFRQVLPVIPKKGREDIVMASINKSYLWHECKVYKLHENMRIEKDVPTVTVDGKSIAFRKWVLDVGDGNARYHNLLNELDPCWIEIPKEVLVPSESDSLATVINAVYSELPNKYADVDFLRNRAILTPINEDVDKLNDEILKMVPGKEHVYESSDSICQGSTNFEDQQVMYPTEFLNSMKFNGIPNHELKLKVGAPIMLLRNLSPSKGLCNGTRLIVTQLTRWMIEAKIITGSHIGHKTFIPRIIMTPSDASLPFILRRRQFPISLCYAMTINKSQGQTVKNVGLYLKRPVFSHGQLYVAISRVTSPTGLKIVIEDNDQSSGKFTKNIVYKEVYNKMY